jgi:FKBP-type peptidyl-prolyl cis-trans isomerase 2
MEKIVKDGDFVSVVYEGVLEDGSCFESSKDTGPLGFKIGGGEVFALFEQTVIGMKINETRSVNLKPEDGFGPIQSELIHTLERSVLSGFADLKPGMVLGLTIEKDGEQKKVPALVLSVDEKNCQVDFNHPLAGKTLTYKITVSDISDKPMG